MKHTLTLLAALLLLCLTPCLTDAAQPRVLSALDISPRRQWNANFGYCGEVSLVSAGLYFGQYCSQFDARATATPGLLQSREDSQLLPGVNVLATAAKMRLRVEEWSAPPRKTTKDFLVWVKRQILLGRPVMVGVLMNEFQFYGDTNPRAGDPDYDHIVPVMGIRSTASSLSAPLRYLRDDSLVFSDNGLWSPKGVAPFFFESAFGTFARTRVAANSRTAPVYSLKNGGNYGVGILGIADSNGDTIPVRLTANVSEEVPAIRDGSSQRPAAMLVTLTATVSMPDQSVAYNLYLYDAFEKVPDSRFNAKSSSATRLWRIPPHSGATHTVSITVPSSRMTVFRAVPASAP